MNLVLGIDLGTSYFKLGLFDNKGNLKGLGRVAVKNKQSKSLLCELKTGDFWKKLKQGLNQACKQAKAEFSDIKAISYSSQANSFILMDKNAIPLTPLILWPDRRAKQIDPVIKGFWGKGDFFEKTGLGIDCTQEFCIVKLRWFQKNKPAIWKKTKYIMTISDYLTFSLTGKRVSDTSTASLLGLLDLPNKKWLKKLLTKIDIDEKQLCKPAKPSTIVGKVNSRGSKLLGLKKDTTFAIGALDHYAAAIGVGAGQFAQVSESTGTVLACLFLTQKYNPKLNCCLGPTISDSEYYLMGFDENGAVNLQWYQQNYASKLSLNHLGKIAEIVPPGSEGLMAKSNVSKYSDLNGFENILKSHKYGHFSRAIMESTAFSLYKLVKDLSDKNWPQTIVSTGGGAKNNLWMQIKADVLGTKFVVTNCEEPASRGAAMFAAIAAGWFRCIKDTADSWIKPVRYYIPDRLKHNIYKKIIKRYYKVG